MVGGTDKWAALYMKKAFGKGDVLVFNELLRCNIGSYREVLSSGL